MCFDCYWSNEGEEERWTWEEKRIANKNLELFRMFAAACLVARLNCMFQNSIYIFDSSLVNVFECALGHIFNLLCTMYNVQWKEQSANKTLKPTKCTHTSQRTDMQHAKRHCHKCMEDPHVCLVEDWIQISYCAVVASSFTPFSCYYL